MKVQIIFILFAAILGSLTNAVPQRFSQMEGQKVPLDPVPMNSNANDEPKEAPKSVEEIDVDTVKEASNDDDESKEATNSVEEIDDDNGKEMRGNCAAGWENFQNEVCFYGLKAKKGFFKGVKECAKLGATFTSIHSMDEFKFITKHWDLHRFWIGIIYGNDKFEDGTDVDQKVFEQFRKFVPWAWPQVPKGFICRAKPGDDVKIAVPDDSVESNEEKGQFSVEENSHQNVENDNSGLDGEDKNNEKEEGNGNGLIGDNSIEEEKNQ